jgi:hypothetical protein
MSDNLLTRLVPHQGCVITRRDDAIEIAGSAMNWVMSAAVAPLVCRAPFTFRVVGRCADVIAQIRREHLKRLCEGR